MKTIIKTTGCIFLILVLLTGCSRVYHFGTTKPENFKYFEGTLIHRWGKKLIVRADDGQEMKFKAGRRTVFAPIPKAWPTVGDRLRIRYFKKSTEWWGYFIAYEVSRIKD